MMRARLPLGAILVAVVLASCGGRPGLTVSLDGKTVAMVLGSTTERTACSTIHGDAFPQNVPVTAIAKTSEVRFEAGSGATSVRPFIYDVDAPPGGPLEEVTLPARGGTYAPRALTAGHTYEVVANVVWSFVVTGGEETHMFRLRMEPP